MGGAATTLLRFEYRLLRIPLQLIANGMTQLDEGAAVRLGYERLLIDCDRAAAYLLHDESAAARACELQKATAPARVTRALQLRRVEQHEEAVDAAEAELLHQHRERFLKRQLHHLR